MSQGEGGQLEFLWSEAMRRLLRNPPRRVQVSLRIRSCMPGHRQEERQGTPSLIQSLEPSLLTSYGRGRRGEGPEGMAQAVVIECPMVGSGPTGGYKEAS